MLKSLTGRFLLLTIIFVMLAEVLIFVPSIARFRHDYLAERLERAQIASLALLATPNDMVDPDLEAELLENAEVLSIALRRDDIRELVLQTPELGMVEATFDLRGVDTLTLIRDGIGCLFMQGSRLIRVIGVPVKGGGQEIEIIMEDGPLLAAMLGYGRNILILSLIISIFTAFLLNLAVRRVLVKPMQKVVDNMIAFQANPEDQRRVIRPSASVTELRRAEETLNVMQQRIAASLKQKDRLAQLGGAVARVSHDLRNMLTTAQLVADRLEGSEDPTVARTAPKLIGSLDRAINLCEQTLAYGKAEEPEPSLRIVDLNDVVGEVIEAEELRMTSGLTRITADLAPEMRIEADPEQLYRIIINLARNARQAIENTGKPGEVTIRARPNGAGVEIDVADTGPGLPKKALDNLFKPFEGGTRRGGSGLGLAIAAELVMGHGGTLDLVETSLDGSLFRFTLPGADIPTKGGRSGAERAPA